MDNLSSSGLPNLGMTCYFNSAVQFLANNEDFVSEMKMNSDVEICRLFVKLCNSPTKKNVEEFFEFCLKKEIVQDAGKEWDPYQFYLQLFKYLESKSVLINTFKLRYRKFSVGCKCKKKRSSYDVCVTKIHMKNSVQESIDNKTDGLSKRDLFEDDDGCEKCKAKKVEYFSALTNLPPYIIIRIDRDTEVSRVIRINDKIAVQTYGGDKEKQYLLVGGIVHIKKALRDDYGGHYISFLKTPKSKKKSHWYMYDDTKIICVSKKEALLAFGNDKTSFDQRCTLVMYRRCDESSKKEILKKKLLKDQRKEIGVYRNHFKNERKSVKLLNNMKEYVNQFEKKVVPWIKKLQEIEGMSDLITENMKSLKDREESVARSCNGNISKFEELIEDERASLKELIEKNKKVEYKLNSQKMAMEKTRRQLNKDIDDWNTKKKKIKSRCSKKKEEIKQLSKTYSEKSKRFKTLQKEIKRSEKEEGEFNLLLSTLVEKKKNTKKEISEILIEFNDQHSALQKVMEDVIKEKTKRKTLREENKKISEKIKKDSDVLKELQKSITENKSELTILEESVKSKRKDLNKLKAKYTKKRDAEVKKIQKRINEMNLKYKADLANFQQHEEDAKRRIAELENNNIKNNSKVIENHDRKKNNNDFEEEEGESSEEGEDDSEEEGESGEDVSFHEPGGGDENEDIDKGPNSIESKELINGLNELEIKNKEEEEMEEKERKLKIFLEKEKAETARRERKKAEREELKMEKEQKDKERNRKDVDSFDHSVKSKIESVVNSKGEMEDDDTDTDESIDNENESERERNKGEDVYEKVSNMIDKEDDLKLKRKKDHRKNDYDDLGVSFINNVDGKIEELVKQTMLDDKNNEEVKKNDEDKNNDEKTKGNTINEQINMLEKEQTLSYNYDGSIQHVIVKDEKKTIQKKKEENEIEIGEIKQEDEKNEKDEIDNLFSIINIQNDIPEDF